MVAERKSVHGSSPQARGTPERIFNSLELVRFIPAGAGNTQEKGVLHNSMTVHPRRRGEHWASSTQQSVIPGSSPQARGTLSN